MKLTKKVIREAKNGLLRRIRELLSMTDEEVLVEHKRCFPYAAGPTAADARQFLVLDCIELAMPSHWVD